MDPCFPSSWDGTGRDGMGDLLDGTAHGGQLPAGWPPTYPYPYPYPYRLRLFVSSFSFLKHNTGPGQDQCIGRPVYPSVGEYLESEAG